MPKLVTMIDTKTAKLEWLRGRFRARGVIVYLNVNAHVPTAYDSVGDYAATTVQGVTGLPTTWNSPAADQGDGTAAIQAGYLLFQPTGTAIVQDITGWFALWMDTAELAMAQKWDTPWVGFGSTLTPAVVVPRELEADIT